MINLKKRGSDASFLPQTLLAKGKGKQIFGSMYYLCKQYIFTQQKSNYLSISSLIGIIFSLSALHIDLSHWFFYD